MNVLNTKTGITLVSLVVTIIVLLILAGVTLVILNGFLLDKIATVSSKTEEAFLKEKIEMAFMEIKTAYESEKETTSMNKSEYFVRELKKSLERGDVEEVIISGTIEEGIKISLRYYNQMYEFKILANGELKLINPLLGNVKVGDYVEYPIQYIDIYSGKQDTSTDGWRVIDDGVMEGTSGAVKIISTGVPAKWFYDKMQYKNGKEAIDILTNHFEESILLDKGIESVNGSIFKIDKMTRKITTLTLAEFNYAYNALYKTSRTPDDMSDPENDEYGLLKLKMAEPYFYWLATKEEGTSKICCVAGNRIYYDADIRIGIRLVIILEDDLNYKLENNVWKITD